MGVPEQKSICMTMGVTRLPRMSQMATMPPITSFTGVKPVANPAAKAPALTVEPTLVRMEYATTSHAAQGKTVDHGILILGEKGFRAANLKQAYVSNSRFRKSQTIFTNDKETAYD